VLFVDRPEDSYYRWTFTGPSSGKLHTEKAKQFIKKHID